MKTKAVTVTVTTSQEVQNQINLIKDEIDKEHKAYEKEVIHHATNMAHQNQPGNDDALEPFIGVIRGYYTRLGNSITLRLSGNTQMLLGSLDHTTAIQEIERLTAERDIFITEQNYAKSDLLKTEDVEIPKEHIMFSKFIWVLLIADILAMTTSFLVLQESFLSSLILGTMFGVCFFISIKATVLGFRDKEVKLGWLRYVITVFLFSVAIIIGLMRGLNGDGETSSILTTIVFIAVNLMICFTNAIIIYIFYPSRIQLKQIEQRTKIQENIKSLKANIEVINGRIQELKLKNNSNSKYRLEVRNGHILLCERVESMFNESIAIFIQTNLRYRTDKQYPNCFKQGIKPLKLKIEDIKIDNQ